MKQVLKTFAVLTAIAIMVAAASAQPKGKGVLWGYVGQVTNSGAGSAQYGNLIDVAGAPAGSFFTFYTDATTDSVTVNGPLKVIHRTGTTTIYQSLAPGDFSSPDSFRSGTAVLVTDLDQQVIVNTVTGSFSVVNVNRATACPMGEVLGEVGGIFRTVLNGQLNGATPPPSGWFGGYATR